MNSAHAIRLLAVMFLLNLFILTWDELKPGNSNPSPIGWPRPQRYVGLAVAFTLLGVFSEIVSAELGAVVGVGLTIALIIRTVQNHNQPTQAVATPTGPITGTQQV